MLIYNANIWRWKEKNSHSITNDGYIQSNSYIITENGIIKEINSMDLINNVIDKYDNKIDINGKLILPGLIDSHIHVSLIGESQYYVDLTSCKSIDNLKSSILYHLTKEETKNLTWIIGVNWDQSLLSRYPNRHDLDEICSDRPIFLWRACWHIGVANTKALEIMGLDINKERPIEGGSIDYDIETNSITGILRERAVELIPSCSNNKTTQEKTKFVIDGLKLCLSSGLTSVQTNDESHYHIYKSLCDNEQLPIRVFLTPTYDDLIRNSNEGGVSNVLIYNDNTSRLQIDRIKLFSDGSLGAETAAIRSLDDNNSDMKGILIYNNEILRSMISRVDSSGYRLEIHAIGDAAAEQVIEAIEFCNISPSTRPILTHCQVLGGDLIERMRGRGIIANIQPSFVPTDMKWVQQRLTSKHQLYSYAWKTLLNSHVYIAGGSDAPIESYSPFLGMYDAIFRKSRVSNEVYRPQECLSFSEALWIYTIGGSYACNKENSLGSIDLGYFADLVVVDGSIVDDPSLLSIIKPDIVIVGGSISYTNEPHSIGHCIELKGPYIPGKGGVPIHKITTSRCCSCCVQQGSLQLR